MKIVKRKIAELIESEYNPRQLTTEQHKQLTDSLMRFGIVDPVIVNKHAERLDIIVGGHQRTKVWSEMGNATIPTVEVDLTPDKEKELNVRLNKNTGQFDFDMLASHFDTSDLVEWGFDEKDLQLGEDDGQPIDAQVEFSEFIGEENNYVVLYFDNELDWLSAQTHFEIKSVFAKRSNGKEWSKGVGRVVNGGKYLKELRDGKREI